MPDYLTEDDDLLNEQGSESENEENGEENKPDPLQLVMQQLSELKESLKPAPKQEEEEDAEEDTTYGFDPSRIVTEAQAKGGEAGTKAYMALRKAEADLRSQFGDELDEAQIEEVIASLAAMPHASLIETVNKRSGHLAMAYAQVGVKYKTGKLGKDKPKSKPSPVGSETPHNGSDPGQKALDEFEKIFGKVTSKAQRDRILSGARGAF